MDQRLERARFLGEQLSAAMDALSEATQGADVVAFLDLLARLEAYPPSELAAVPDLCEQVDTARKAREAHAEALGAAAGKAIDLDHLLAEGRHLPTDDPAGARDAWLRDVLRLATVMPWMSSPRRAQAGWALKRALAMVEAEAEAFLDASVLATDRRALEAPEGLGEDARAFLELLGDLPIVVAFERAPAGGTGGRLDRVLEGIKPASMEAVDDALTDHTARGQLRLPSASERLALAAADEQHTTLLRMEGGAWELVRHRGRLSLRYEGGCDDVSVSIDDGEEGVALAADNAGAFLLPDAQVGLTLHLRVGPDSRVVRIDAPLS